MSIAVKPTDPQKKVEPPRKYPDWLVARFTDANAPIPKSVMEEDKPKIEPWMMEIRNIGKSWGAGPPPPAKYVPPPMVVQQTPMIKVKFKVLNLSDRPIFGFGIRVNDKNLVTDKRGEAVIDVYQGHDLMFSTGRESGWSFPNGAKRKLRMTGMVPLGQTLPITASQTILLYPESGEYQLNGKTYAQPITYTTS
ncbi:MAG: hypothetical protein K940chlam2_01438 [Chlamydiae bacterium]|nr:hypothetical protein [Chlamydiota bacterium]